MVSGAVHPAFLLSGRKHGCIKRASHGLFKYAPAGMMRKDGGQRPHICATLTTAFEILHGKGLTPAAEEVVLTGNANYSYYALPLSGRDW